MDAKPGRLPTQIGEALWRNRARMDLSLEDVALKAGVDLQTLRAIEDSDFARMPAKDATIAAARAYARVVGLPEKWAAATLATELPSATGLQPAGRNTLRRPWLAMTRFANAAMIRKT